jgi:protein SCO1/2
MKLRAAVSMRALVMLLALLLLWSASRADQAPTLRAGVFDPPRGAPEFALRGSDGAELSLARFRGKVVILGFGFSSCPDVCPITLSTLAQARKELGAEAKDVQVVYITVDPERDDAARLKEYLGSFDATFVGGTGSAEELSAVRKAYGIAAERKDSPVGATFAHSSHTCLIDRQGRLRALMPYGAPAADYSHDLRILLAP